MHEKTGLMCTKYTSLYYSTYFLYCMFKVLKFCKFSMKCCRNDRNFIRLLFLSTKLFEFEIEKYGQISCAHKPYFLMPGHTYIL